MTDEDPLPCCWSCGEPFVPEYFEDDVCGFCIEQHYLPEIEANVTKVYSVQWTEQCLLVEAESMREAIEISALELEIEPDGDQEPEAVQCLQDSPVLRRRPRDI